MSKLKNLDVLQLHQERTNKLRKKRIRRNRLIFLLAIIVISILLYSLFNSLFGDNSKIKGVEITNNIYYTDAEILELADINYDENFYFYNISEVESNLKDLIISKVNVKKSNGNKIVLEFDNENILYYFTDLDQIYLMSDKNKQYTYSNNMFNVLSMVPYLNSFPVEDRSEITKLLKSIDKQTLGQISEIEDYSSSFEENMIKLTMEDGNKLFVDKESFSMIESYSKIVDNLKERNACIYFDKSTSSAVVKDCQEG